MLSAEREFTLLEYDEESGSESEFTKVDLILIILMI